MPWALAASVSFTLVVPPPKRWNSEPSSHEFPRQPRDAFRASSCSCSLQHQLSTITYSWRNRQHTFLRREESTVSVPHNTYISDTTQHQRETVLFPPPSMNDDDACESSRKNTLDFMPFYLAIPSVWPVTMTPLAIAASHVTGQW
jgi:hypothetical protein